jgi:hypothetical protein
MDNVSGVSNEIAARASFCQSQTVRNNLTKAQIRTRFRVTAPDIMTSHFRPQVDRSERRRFNAVAIFKLGPSLSERCPARLQYVPMLLERVV